MRTSDLMGLLNHISLMAKINEIKERQQVQQGDANSVAPNP